MIWKKILKTFLIKKINTLEPFYMNLVRLLLRNIMYQKKKLTVRKELIENYNTELVISIGADVDVNVNQWQHLLKVSA